LGLASTVPGPAGKDGEVSKDFMKTNTLWCADGELCKVPVGKYGMEWGTGSKMFDKEGDFNLESTENMLFKLKNKTIAKMNTSGTTFTGSVTGDSLISGDMLETRGGHVNSKGPLVLNSKGGSVFFRNTADGDITKYTDLASFTPTGLTVVGDIKSNKLQSNGLMVTGDIKADGFLRANKLESNGLALNGKNTIAFGEGMQRGQYNGNIGYQTFTDALDIVGAGTTPENRKTKVFGQLAVDKLVLGQWQFQQADNGNLHIHRGDVNDWSAALTTGDGGNLHVKGNVRSEKHNAWM
jgi:cytoskeletal protein CcmA (bactofilin family)